MSTTVYFHGFADLPHERGSSVMLSTFRCLGHEWFLKIYPGGDAAKDETEVPVEEEVALFLTHAERGNIKIECSLRSKGFTNVAFYKHFYEPYQGHGYSKFLTRKTALTQLVKGAFVVEFRMKAVKDPPTFDPETARRFLIIDDFFMEKESADVVFEVRGKQPAAWVGSESDVSSTQFYAHRLIVRKASPQLADLCMLSDGKSPSVIELPIVSVDAFEALLRYIYGLNIFNVGNDILRIKDILETADKYGLITLKLKAEELLISSISFTTENAIDHFHYAESKNCAVLKERVVDFIVEKWLSSNKEKDVPDYLASLMHDMMMAVEIKHRTDYCSQNYARLRQKAYDEGLEVDGSRETLISILK